MTLATIQGAHTIDLATAVLGDFADLTALGSTQYPQVTVEGGRPPAADHAGSPGCDRAARREAPRS